MPIYRLPDDEIWFPEPSEFDGDIVAVGGDLTAERLLEGYARGIFPWYNDPGEIIWWCPAKRCILVPEELKISHSMRNVLNKKTFRITMDTAFSEVLEGCRSGERENATWLIDEMAEAYHRLHRLGYAHSVEVWHHQKLVGGLYGVSLGHVFFGESMFSKETNSSKAAFIALAQFIQTLGWKMLDCQVYTNHLGSLGAKEIPREEFLQVLKQELSHKTRVGKWNLKREP